MADGDSSPASPINGLWGTLFRWNLSWYAGLKCRWAKTNIFASASAGSVTAAARSSRGFASRSITPRILPAE